MKYVLSIWDIFSLVHSIAKKKNYPLRILHNVICMLGLLHLICHERGQVTLCCMSRHFKCPSYPKRNLGASHVVLKSHFLLQVKVESMVHGTIQSFG